MSALVLHTIPRGSAFAETCEEIGCKKKGRYRVEIAGRPMLSEYSLGKPQQAQLCQGHGREWRELWRELNGEAAAEHVAAAVDALAGNPVERVDAIDTLRQLGCSPEAVTKALAATGRREPREQILDALAAAA